MFSETPWREAAGYNHVGKVKFVGDWRGEEEVEFEVANAVSCRKSMIARSGLKKGEVGGLIKRELCRVFQLPLL